MKNCKLHYKLEILNKTQLLFQIIDMDERFRGYYSEYISGNGIPINSVLKPQIYTKNNDVVIAICLRGSNKLFDDKYILIDVRDATEERKRITEALSEWGKCCPCFKDPNKFSALPDIVSPDVHITKHIRFRLEAWGKENLVFQVLWMDDRFNGKNYDAGIELFPLKIVSAAFPGLEKEVKLWKNIRTIYLHGKDDDKDSTVSTVMVEDAMVEKDRIIRALQDWSDNWEGFNVDCEKKNTNTYCIK